MSPYHRATQASRTCTTHGGGEEAIVPPIRLSSNQKSSFLAWNLGQLFPFAEKKATRERNYSSHFRNNYGGGVMNTDVLSHNINKRNTCSHCSNQQCAFTRLRRSSFPPPPFPSPPKTRKKSGQIISQRCARPTRSHELFEPLNHHAQKKGRSAQGTGVHSIRHWRGMIVNMFCDSARARVLANKG